MKKEDIIELVKDNLPSTVNLDKFLYIKTEDIGYFGRVNSKDFISYNNLCDMLDFHEGELMKNAGWLLFWYKGSVLFISQHTVRYNLSWDSIIEHNLVYGERSVDIGNNNYSVMLPTGGNKKNNGEGSMWDDLIFKVHEEYRIWDKLSDEDLNINWSKCTVGTSSWCQESYDDYRTDRTKRGYTHRGGFRLQVLVGSTPSSTGVGYGARLVLKKDYE